MTVSDRRLAWACISASLAGVLLSAFLHSNWTSPNTIYSDIASLWGRSWVSGGQVPYMPDSFLEYPPVSGLVLYGSRLIGGSIQGVFGGLYSGYYVAFSGLSLAAAAVLGWSTWRLATSLGVKANPAYFLLPTMIVYGIYNFDLFNALFVVLGIQMFVEKRNGLSAAFVGVALATKLVAVFLIPIFLMELSDDRERAKYLVVSAVAATVFFVPIAVFNFGYFGQFLSFFQHWGLEDAWYIWIFGDPFSSAAKGFALILLGLLLLRVYTLKVPLLPKAFLAISAYLLSTYIYAPQFNVVLIPLAAVLVLSTPSYYLMEVFNALIILTWFTVPQTPTSGPTYPGTLPQTMALLRSASLAALCISVASNAGNPMWKWLSGKWEPADKSPLQSMPDPMSQTS